MKLSDLARQTQDNAPASKASISVFFSSLRKASEKQRRFGAERLYTALAYSFARQAERAGAETMGKDTDLLPRIAEGVQEDIAVRIPAAEKTASELKNRGALRALTWGKKVAAIQKSLVNRFLLKDADETEQQIYLCEACGFIALGGNAPAVCPVCKAPASRFSEVK